jgi:hypothetical protein
LLYFVQSYRDKKLSVSLCVFVRRFTCAGRYGQRRVSRQCRTDMAGTKAPKEQRGETLTPSSGCLRDPNSFETEVLFESGSHRVVNLPLPDCPDHNP